VVFGYSCKELVQGELNACIDFILEPPVFWVDTCACADVISVGKSACGDARTASCTRTAASTRTAGWWGGIVPQGFADRGGETGFSSHLE
jgi:hypothetical protein